MVKEVDLSKVNSKVAKRVLNRMRSPTLAKPRKGMMAGEVAEEPSKYDLVENEIKVYEKAVNETLTGLRNKAALDLAVTGITIIFFILAVIFSNLNGILASIGLGGTNAYSQAKSWQGTVLTYWSDRAKLRHSISHLRMMLVGCKRTDDACLQKVDDMANQYFDALNKAIIS